MKYWNSLTASEKAPCAVLLGKFDGLHLGHRSLLEAMNRYSAGLSKVILAIDFGQDRQGNLFTSEEKLRICGEAGLDVYYRVAFEDLRTMSAEAFIKEILCERLGAKQVYVGEDFRFGYERTGDVKLLKRICPEYGIEVFALPEVIVKDIRVSCTEIRRFVKEGRTADIPELLGSSYFVSGETKQGRRLGRTISYPTLNLVPNAEKLLPPAGVYRTITETTGRFYPSITNIGNNPTVCADNPVTIETHLLETPKEELPYGVHIRVFFGEMLRGERKFSSLDELKEQIRKDIEFARKCKNPIYK